MGGHLGREGSTEGGKFNPKQEMGWVNFALLRTEGVKEKTQPGARGEKTGETSKKNNDPAGLKGRTCRPRER